MDFVFVRVCWLYPCICPDKHAILNSAVLFCVLPSLPLGAHAKKQAEDLSDNDGDEDEGISMVPSNSAWCCWL